MLSSDHDTDVEEFTEEEVAKHKQRIFDMATEKNMPKNSTAKERKIWPDVWTKLWEKIADAEDKVNDERARKNNRPTKPQIEKAIRVLGLNHLDIAEEYRTENETVKKWFKKLYTQFSYDKMATSGPDMDPRGVDCTTLAKRSQAWMTRAQDLVAAKDDLIARNKYGARMNFHAKTGQWY